MAHGQTGLLTPFHDPAALADSIGSLLEDRGTNARLREGARAYAEANLRMEDHIAGFRALINGMTDGRLGPPAAP